VHHFPDDLSASGRPGVGIDGFVSFDGEVVFFRVGGEVAVGLGGGNAQFSVFGEAASGFLYRGKCFG
jgi:hypothetical protein